MQTSGEKKKGRWALTKTALNVGKDGAGPIVRALAPNCAPGCSGEKKAASQNDMGSFVSFDPESEDGQNPPAPESAFLVTALEMRAKKKKENAGHAPEFGFNKTVFPLAGLSQLLAR